MNKITTHLIGALVLCSLFAWIGVAMADGNSSAMRNASEVKAQTASTISMPLASIDALSAADLMTANMPSPYTAQRVN